MTEYKPRTTNAERDTWSFKPSAFNGGVIRLLLADLAHAEACLKEREEQIAKAGEIIANQLKQIAERDAEIERLREIIIDNDYDILS